MRMLISTKSGSTLPPRPEITLNSRAGCPDIGTPYPKGLIGALNSGNMLENAFYLGNVGLRLFSISGETSQERAHTMTRPEITSNQAPVPRSRLGLPVPVTIHGVTYPSQTAAALALGVSARTVSAAKKRDALDRVGLDAFEPLTIRGVTYPSQTAAALALGVSTRAVGVAKKRDTLDRVGLGNAEPLTIRGVTYPSHTAAALALGVSTRAVSAAKKRDALDRVGLRKKAS
jgi:hypothetical protein